MTGPVLLARHGQTERNAEGRYQGSLDSPLTSVGRAQARATAEASASSCITANRVCTALMPDRLLSTYLVCSGGLS